MAAALGAEIEIIDFGRNTPIDPDRVAAVLRADTDGKIKAVLAVHVDTSTSVRSDMAALSQAMAATGHPALLMADCIASFACDPFEMDAWGVDVLVTGCQKGLMVPPGMAFVFFNERAAAVRSSMERVSSYWDWVPRTRPEIYYQYFAGTAPTHHLYGLRTALDMILEEGIEAVWDRHAILARAIWAACEKWGEDGPLRLNVEDAAHRSHAVTAIRVGAPHGTKLRRWTADQAGLTLGIGLGMSEPDDPKSDGFFRFGHMGHVNAQMIMGLLGTVESGLAALDVPHGAGGVVEAARVIATATKA
jgi:alanine-glyoxylate transaminase/serine-glyoxylate transaminase/serine-pyruvate transaminase